MGTFPIIPTANLELHLMRRNARTHKNYQTHFPEDEWLSRRVTRQTSCGWETGEPRSKPAQSDSMAHAFPERLLPEVVSMENMRISDNDNPVKREYLAKALLIRAHIIQELSAAMSTRVSASVVETTRGRNGSPTRSSETRDPWIFLPCHPYHLAFIPKVTS